MAYKRSRFKSSKNIVITKKKNNGRINSKSVVVYGVELKSILEGNIYKYMVDNGFNIQYEPQSFLLWKGGPTHTPFYNAKKGDLKCFKSDLEDITYKPDFIFTHNGRIVFVEAKGIENDGFPIRKKLFRRQLDESFNPGEALFFEIHSMKHLKNMLEILEYGKIITKSKKTVKNEK